MADVAERLARLVLVGNRLRRNDEVALVRRDSEGALHWANETIAQSRTRAAGSMRRAA